MNVEALKQAARDLIDLHWELCEEDDFEALDAAFPRWEDAIIRLEAALNSKVH